MNLLGFMTYSSCLQGSSSTPWVCVVANCGVADTVLKMHAQRAAMVMQDDLHMLDTCTYWRNYTQGHRQSRTRIVADERAGRASSQAHMLASCIKASST
jgi:hypothetical protein